MHNASERHSSAAVNAANVNDVREQRLVGRDVNGIALRVPDTLTTMRVRKPIGGGAAVCPSIGLGGGKLPDRDHVHKKWWFAMARQSMGKPGGRDSSKALLLFEEFPAIPLNGAAES